MKYVANVVAIIVLVIVVVLVVNLKNNATEYPFQYEIKSFFKEISKIIQIKQHNIKMELSPSRRKRTTFIEKEEVLRQFLPQVFATFNDSDWNHFWGLIYDPVYDKKNKYGKKRFNTKAEIERTLIERFSNPFSSFTDGQWSSFWNIIDVNLQDN